MSIGDKIARLEEAVKKLEQARTQIGTEGGLNLRQTRQAFDRAAIGSLSQDLAYARQEAERSHNSTVQTIQTITQTITKINEYIALLRSGAVATAEPIAQSTNARVADQRDQSGSGWSKEISSMPTGISPEEFPSLRSYADSLRALKGPARPKTVSEYVSASGNVYRGSSGSPRRLKNMPAELKRLLDQAGHDGGCAEAESLLKAYLAEGSAGIRGGAMLSLSVRGTGATGDRHGRPIPACERQCSGLLQNLAIEEG